MKKTILTITALTFGAFLNNNLNAAEGKTESAEVKALREEMKALKDMFAQFMSTKTGKEQKAAGGADLSTDEGVTARKAHPVFAQHPGKGWGVIETDEDKELNNLILTIANAQGEAISKQLQTALQSEDKFLRKLLQRLKQETGKSEKALIASLRANEKSDKELVIKILISLLSERKNPGQRWGRWGR